MKKLIYILTVVVVLYIILLFLSVYISPASIQWISVLPFTIQYALIALGVLLVIWIFISWKMLIPLALLLFIGLLYHSHNCVFGDKSVNEISRLKVLSYNVKLFGFLDTPQDSLRKIVVDNITETKADIVCLQEAYWHDSPAAFPTLVPLSKGLNVKYLKKNMTSGFNHGASGLAIFSKYPIINSYNCAFDSSANGYMYVDLLMDKDTVRVYNCHFQSIRISSTDVDISNENKEAVQENSEKIKKLYSKFLAASEKRSQQVDLVRKSIDSCKYHLLVCGDFNDIPLSYTCFRLLNAKNKLRDTFIERGKDDGRTFILKDKNFRIDYILHDDYFHCVKHSVIEKNIVDDHYPVLAEFK